MLIVDRSIYVFHIVYNLHVMLDDIFFIINQHIWTSDCNVLLVCILYCWVWNKAIKLNWIELNKFNWISGEARQEQKPRFDQQDHDCTLTAITCALRLRRHELIVQCELSDVIARSIRRREAWKFSTADAGVKSINRYAAKRFTFERRVKGCQSAWRRRKYKSTFS